VRRALEEAGARPADPLFAVGHSGGGVVAAALAGDPTLNVVGAVSLGGPVASAPLADGVPLPSIEHEEDLVPATGGWGHPSPDRLTVSRSVLEAGRAYDAAVPAHELVRYRETAALIDASEEARLVEFRERLAEFTGGREGAMTRWIGTRT
jgi:pimeloyl-ACP methyl ester carboxylesterase